MMENKAYQEQTKEVKLNPPPEAHLLKDDGLYKVILTPGTGKEKPAKGSLVTIHYQRRVIDPEAPDKPSSIFDSSYAKSKKVIFNVGRGNATKGYDIAIMTMLQGEKCKVVCAPKYWYGAWNSPPISPNSVVEDTIELFEWEGEDLSPEGDKSLIREILVDGKDFMMPYLSSYVDIELIGKYKDREFYNRKFWYQIGEADPEMDLVPAIDMALQHMRTGERCRLLVKSKYGFGSEGSKKFEIPPDADLEYELLLKIFEKIKEPWQMTDHERVENSKKLKERGNDFVKEGKVKKAAIQYKKIVKNLARYDAIADRTKFEQEFVKDWMKLNLAGHLNLALCYNKLKQHENAIDMCTEALKLDPHNEKGLYRAGEAYFHLQEYINAREKFKQVIDLYPTNKSAHTWHQKCLQECKKLADENKRYVGMFDKFSSQDEKQNPKKRQKNLPKEEAEMDMTEKLDKLTEGS